MALVLGHMENYGANINGTLLTKVTNIDSRQQTIELEVKRRRFDLRSKTPKIDEIIKGGAFSVDDKIFLEDDLLVTVSNIQVNQNGSHRLVRLVYEAPKEYTLARINYAVEKVPWRPAFESEGINETLLGAHVEESWTMLTTNHQLFGFAVVRGKIKVPTVTYLLSRKDDSWRILAGMAKGKFYFSPLKEKAPSSEGGITPLQYLKALQSQQDYFKVFRSIPSPQPEWSYNTKIIREFLTHCCSKKGPLDQTDVERYIFGYTIPPRPTRIDRLRQRLDHNT